MAAPELQANRYELKYLLPERVALEIRDFLSGYLEIDEYGATMPDLSYPVHSLYIDSRALYTYWATINGDKNRYKLRLRYYTDKPDAPVFFEIKRRTDNVISKQRCGVRRASVPGILSGQLPYQTDLLSKDPRQYRALQNFLRLMGDIRGEPCSHVFYMREAWISTYDNSVRVTLDRFVQCEPDRTVLLSASMVNPVTPFGNQVILELKFTARFPDWFRTLVQTFHLPQCGAAKYALGIETYGESRMMGAFAFDGNGSAAKISSSDKEIPVPNSPKMSSIQAPPPVKVEEPAIELAGKQ